MNRTASAIRKLPAHWLKAMQLEAYASLVTSPIAVWPRSGARWIPFSHPRSDDHKIVCVPDSLSGRDPSLLVPSLLATATVAVAVVTTKGY
jgi:hypothetical protein